MTDTADPEPVETTDSEDTEVLLADPEDYHQAQRLREIHEARRNVHTVLNNIKGFTGSDEHTNQQLDLADAVTLYASEILPPANAADLDTGFDLDLPWDDLEEYTVRMGRDPDREESIPGYPYHNAVFQKCNALLAEMKPLIEEDDASEWEV